MQDIWNPKIPLAKCPAFKTGKELTTLNQGNNLTQHQPICDLEQNDFKP